MALSRVQCWSVPYQAWLLPHEGGAVQQSSLLLPDQTIDAPVARGGWIALGFCAVKQ